ncbi:MAG: glycoside hydrolase family 32 protein [Bacteroidales bacterium]
MKSTISFVLMILLSLVSCSQDDDKVFLVKSGVPATGLDLPEHWSPEDNYLESQGEYYLEAEQALKAGNFHMQIRLEINTHECVLGVMAGDNLFTFNNIEEAASGEIVLEGPSFHKAHRTGYEPEEVIPLNIPFVMAIICRDRVITCSVDGKEIISVEVVNDPFGRVMLDGWSEKGSVRLYDWSVRGEMVSLEECYSRENLLARAQRSLEKRAEEVKGDPNRPIYHLQPPANWNNDPNGTMYFNGYYHMFYQLNPFADHWGWMHWGHMRSKDLVKWEHLPIALWPSIEKGEVHCFSGSAIVNRLGEPMLFYTSIGHEDPEHWVAVPKDEELVEWEKHPANPIITIDDHQGDVIREWRDPQLIHEGDETFMVIGGHPEGKGGSIMFYKALNEELTEWDYLGVPFSGEQENWECPNFFRIGDAWVIVCSPYGPVEYYTGSFDLENYQFTPEYNGMVDLGSNFYAPNTMEDEKGRRLLWGWIPGFKENQGWQGAITIPRSLSVTPEGWLVQEPVEEFIALRGEHSHRDAFLLEEGTEELDVPDRSFELVAELSNQSADRYGLRLNLEEGVEVFEISVEEGVILFGEEKISLEPFSLGNDLDFRLFFDRTILELFVNNGLVCATSVVYPDREDPGWEVFSEGGNLMVNTLDIWKINSIYEP